RSPRAPRTSLFPYTTLFRSRGASRSRGRRSAVPRALRASVSGYGVAHRRCDSTALARHAAVGSAVARGGGSRLHGGGSLLRREADRKSTRLNSSHRTSSYAV